MEQPKPLDKKDMVTAYDVWYTLYVTHPKDLPSWLQPDTILISIDKVKSVIEGMKKEIESKIIPIDRLPNKKEIISDTKEKFVSDFNIEVDEILKIVDKWFKPLIEEVQNG
mgnify:CR=1 FL=1